MNMLRRVKKFVMMPLPEKGLMGEAFFFLLWYSLLIYTMPYRWWESRIGQKMQPWKKEGLSPAQMKQAARIRRGVFRANKILFGLCKCFALSLTIKQMLKKRGIESTLYLGVKKGEPDSLLAHAWLKCGSITVYGGHQAAKHYRELVVYT
jgi:hypothetical protein